MKKRVILFAIAILLPFLMNGENKPKYVFYFIGDGMGFNHVTLAEYYNGYMNGNWGPLPISFSEFPVLGMASTFSATNLITDSAAGGTALATGHKTKNGAIGVNADCTEELESIAYKIHEEGFKVGISSTVGLNHATPAAFYGHNCSRSNYYDIALEIGKSNFEFFGGGGIINYKGKDNSEKSIYKIIKKDRNGTTDARSLIKSSSPTTKTRKSIVSPTLLTRRKGTLITQISSVQVSSSFTMRRKVSSLCLKVVELTGRPTQMMQKLQHWRFSILQRL